MEFAIDHVPVEARARYTELGRQFGCVDTLAQAKLTLLAFERYGDQVARHGFIQLDADRLREVRDLLHQMTLQATDEDGRCKKTSQEYVQAIRGGKDARQRARSILYIIAQRLALCGDFIAAEAARAVVATLQQTESSRGDPFRLAAQLDQLRATLTIPRVDKEAERRGGPDAAQALVHAAEKLRAIANRHSVETHVRQPDNDFDLLCGMI
ncbi:MAG TPA: hypothetical protein PL065_24625, partial [Polyangiaceae bacterium]|nr:hypothetical protein [Polyangiaceae bacterium]